MHTDLKRIFLYITYVFKVCSQIISTLKLYIKELNLMVLLSGVNEFLLFKMILQLSLRHHL